MSEEEVLNVESGKLDEINQKTRLLKGLMFDDLGVHRKGDPLVESKRSNNVFKLSSEGRPFKVEKEHTSINGNPSSIQTSKASIITKDATINGVEFVSDSSNDSVTQVQVNESATAVFIGCTFRRSSSGTGATMVVVDSGAFAIFIGCKFLQGTYPVLNNTSVGYCTLIGCYKTGGTGNYNDPAGNAVTTLGSL